MSDFEFNRRIMQRPILAAIAAMAAILVLGCDRGGTAPIPQRPPPAVRVAQAVARDVPLYLDEIGRTVSMEVVSIVPQVGGKVIAAHVEEGSDVKKGQLLFEIDPRPFDVALASARASLGQAKAQRDLAAREFARAQEMKAANTISSLEFDQRKSEAEQGDARVAGAEAAVQAADLNVEYTKIKSPISGRAGARLVDPGNIVKPNDAPMMVIQKLDPIYAEFTITENELGSVRKFMVSAGLDLGAHPERGLKVLVDIPGDSTKVLGALAPVQPSTSATSPASRPTTRAGAREGTLSFLDNAVQSGTGTVRLRATLPNADRYFWPGQFVNVRLVLAIKKNAVLIPIQAQQIGQQGPFVYVVAPPPAAQGGVAATQPAPLVAQIRPIRPGQRQGDLIVVESGVEAGESVIVTGQMAVVPNAPVMVLPDAPPAGPVAGR